MPLYEYECKSCGQEIELMQRMGDPPPETCTHCGAGPMHKKISHTSFLLKGGGWYKDGYSSTSSSGSTGSTSSSSTSATTPKNDSTSKSETSKATSGSDTSKASKNASATA